MHGLAHVELVGLAADDGRAALAPPLGLLLVVLGAQVAPRRAVLGVVDAEEGAPARGEGEREGERGWGGGSR